MGSKVVSVENFLEIEKRIFVFRERQVMLDKDLAFLYGVETRALNQAVKRNVERFPEDFMFQLSKSELEVLISQNVTSSWGGDRKLPYAFTENGIAMLSGILRSETAIQVNIRIMRTFTQMRKFLANNAQVFARLDRVEMHQLEADKKIEELFTKMESCGIEQRQGVFFQGQIFDAYVLFEKIIQGAKKDVVLIDGYVDLTILERFAQKKSGVNVTIYTHPQTALSKLDIQKFNSQYPTLTVNHTTKMHDRFMIVDNTDLYHIGASLKDLGLRCFAFEKMNDAKILIPEILKNV